ATRIRGWTSCGSRILSSSVGRRGCLCSSSRTAQSVPEIEGAFPMNSGSGGTRRLLRPWACRPRSGWGRGLIGALLRKGATVAARRVTRPIVNDFELDQLEAQGTVTLLTVTIAVWRGTQ